MKKIVSFVYKCECECKCQQAQWKASKPNASTYDHKNIFNIYIFSEKQSKMILILNIYNQGNEFKMVYTFEPASWL